MEGTQKKIRLGIIGTGIFAINAHLPVLKRLSNLFEIKACCNRSIEKAQEYAKIAGLSDADVYTDHLKLLEREDIDAVSIAVPVQFNLALCKAAFSAGKHVIIEKPIAATLQDAQEIINLADKSPNHCLLIAENWVYKPTVQEAVRVIKADMLGKILSVTANVVRTYRPTTNPYLNTAWRQNPEHPGGYLSDGGVHVVSLLTSTIGNVKEVCAHSRFTYPIHGADDVMSATLLFENGVIGTLHMNYAAEASPTNYFSIIGTKATAVIDGYKLTVVDSKNETLATTIEDGETRPDITNEYINFHAAITEKKQSLLSVQPRDTFEHLAIIVAALRSTQSKKVESVPKSQ